jgi:hypothetical protein
MLKPKTYPEFADRTFLIGVGAMKCATSWVFRSLEDMPGVAVSPLKELRFFDADLPRDVVEPVLVPFAEQVRDYLGQSPDPEEELRINPHLQSLVDRLRMTYSEEAYAEHFARLVTPETKVFCEISPAYAMLGVEGYKRMRDYIHERGADLKTLFIMRDPVDRLWSHLRYDEQRKPEVDALRDWQDMVRTSSVIGRSNYRFTVDALDQVFGPEGVLYLFYEDLFDSPSLGQLCAFAGLPQPSNLPLERQNETTVTIALPDDIREALRRLLAPQYAYCRDRFGDAIPAAWGS